MDNNNWRPTQGGGESAMDAGGDWRSQLHADSRQRIVNKMLLGAQSGNSVMPNNQHSVHMLQQSQESVSNMLPNQTQQMMSQIQSQPGQLQKQPGLQQQQNPLQRDMQQRLQTPGILLQQPNVIDQQKQVFQPQGAMPEASSTSLDSTAQTRNANGGDWQEEIYQKIKSMKDMYFLDLNDMFHKIAAKLHQIEPLLQQQPHLQQGKKLQLEKLKAFKRMLERFISLLQVSKSNIQIGYKDKLGSYEKQIMSILNSNRPRKPIMQMQQGQALPPPHMHSLQQTQTPQSQLTQLQPLENQMNLQMQSLNLQGYVGTMHQKTMGMLE